MQVPVAELAALSPSITLGVTAEPGFRKCAGRTSIPLVIAAMARSVSSPPSSTAQLPSMVLKGATMAITAIGIGVGLKCSAPVLISTAS